MDRTAAPADALPVVRPASQTYFPALDGIRALAFLMVFAQHYLQTPWGWAGVDIFFVLSGFLITGILYDTREQRHRVRNFYIRRTLRIFPLYYGVMLLLLLSYPYFRWQWNWTWLLWPAYLGNFCRGIHPYTQHAPLEMLANFQPLSATINGVQLYFGHFWSLCVEEQFYLIWPWVVFWIKDRRVLTYICAASLVVCPALRIAGSHLLPAFMIQQEVLFRWTPFRIDSLLLGGLIALIYRGQWRSSLLPAARTLFLLLGAAILAYLAYGYTHRNLGLAHPAWSATWGLTLIDLFSASIIVMALQPGSITFRIFHIRPLRWLGRITYGAYVFHDIFHLEIQALVQHFTSHVKYGTAAFALVFTILVSWASFRLYETPFIRLKDRWTKSPATMQPNKTEVLPA